MELTCSKCGSRSFIVSVLCLDDYHVDFQDKTARNDHDYQMVIHEVTDVCCDKCGTRIPLDADLKEYLKRVPVGRDSIVWFP